MTLLPAAASSIRDLPTDTAFDRPYDEGARYAPGGHCETAGGLGLRGPCAAQPPAFTLVGASRRRPTLRIGPIASSCMDVAQLIADLRSKDAATRGAAAEQLTHLEGSAQP